MSESSDSKRPRNAAPIPFPGRHESISPPFDEFVGSLPTASPSVYSEFNVVLDDGTLQKRTVSLSTLPDDSNDNLEELVEVEEEDGEVEEDEAIETKQYDDPTQTHRKPR